MVKKNRLGKQCFRCKQYKSYDDFGTDNSRPDKKTIWCKDCNKISKMISNRRNKKRKL